MEMHKRVLALLGVVVVGCVMANQAKAAVSFQYVTDASSYTGASGTTVDVTIYLQETLTAGSTDIITPEGGLIGAGAAVNVSGTTGGTAASIPSSSFTLASPFVTLTADYNQGTGNNLEFVGLAGNSGPFAFPTSGKVELGVVAITVGTGQTTYLLTSLNEDTINGSNSLLGQSDGNTLTDKGTDLDVSGTSMPASDSEAYTGADASAGFSFVVGPPSTAVPLPASLWLGIVGLGGLPVIRRALRVSNVA
jgi:hypothetical protein